MVPSHNGSSVILSIFKDMLSVGEQQESLLLRELETDITIPRCIEIISYLEENIALVGHVAVSSPAFQRVAETSLVR